MTKLFKYLFLTLVFSMLISHVAHSQQRFPKPEFENGYEQPSPTTPEPRALTMDYVDVGILFLVLCLATWLVLKRRSRGGILLLSIFTLVYFGFYRNGCVCSVGSVQNVVLTLFDPTYSISLVVLIFFLLPLVFTLLFGRTFCAGACPLGVIQDLLIFKPINIPEWLRKGLGVIPYLYLGLAVLYAATGTDFIICRYDPFVGIYRVDARFIMVVLGIAFLLIGMFVARPYCRFFCPYGVLLNWMSRFSWKHMTITPSNCINCKLCETSCPFEAIEIPQELPKAEQSKQNLKRFILYVILIPLLMGAGAYIGLKSHVFLSKANKDIYLAELLISKPELRKDLNNIDIQEFMSADKSLDTLVEEAGVIRGKFKKGSWILGAILGLVIALKLVNLVTFRKKTDYKPHKGDCYSCGRCMDYCPVPKTI